MEGLLMTKKSRHDRYDRDYLSVASIIDEINSNTVNVISKKQAIVNKAITMTNEWNGRKITNDKELKQLHSVIRQVNTMNNNLEYVKEATYLLSYAPADFIHNINKLIDSCNDYIESNVLLQLDSSVCTMDKIDINTDLKGIVLYKKEYMQ